MTNQPTAQGNRIVDFPSPTLLGGCAALMATGSMFEFLEECEKLGPVVRARIFHKSLYLVTGPEQIEEILLTKAKSFHKPIGLRALRWVFGTGLLTSNGELWKHRRKLVQPAFHQRHQADYAAELATRIEAMLARVRPGQTDVHEHVVQVCVEQLMSRFFASTDPELIRAVRGAATSCHDATQTLMAKPWYYMLPGPVERRYGEPLRRLERALLQLLRERRARGAARGDFFDLLAHGKERDGCPLGFAAARDEAITMILAGHETVASGVTWALYLLARHPDVQRRLAGELASASAAPVPTPSELSGLTLLNRVVKETFRLYPPTHRIGRTSIEPVNLAGVPLPARAELLISQWAVHRSPRYYDRPTEFDPDRWTDELVARLPRFAYLPFSAGPHVCIGQGMATLEVSLVVAALVRAFELRLPADWRGDPAPAEGLTLLPCPVPLTLRRRTDQN
jgi:cytochrome P450